jgi:hypothetical protein
MLARTICNIYKIQQHSSQYFFFVEIRLNEEERIDAISIQTTDGTNAWSKQCKF